MRISKLRRLSSGTTKTYARVGKVATDDLRVARNQDTNNTRLATTFTVSAPALCQHFITVHAHLHLFARQIQVVFAAFHAQEAKAIAMADNHAFEQVETFRSA
ncbi:Uncharacterised protein [Kluyvera cryocrescens]|uniref:Uncharacterized protein n=1 Tax=Kluyvera cryocrescens TaxID=580 RepID=A0A485BCU2_KLUCR|nr:Uncharacterised protein [Kluyvera cryocrescens]